jgi:glycosyltransferase involved in cell wall biosynthesis
MRKTRIIVPCYNESERLDSHAFLDALVKNADLSFLFVNDGSTDGTLQLLRSLKDENPGQIEVLNLERNAGKAEAVRQGMLASMEGVFEYIGYWDADLATPLSEIDGFCRLLDATDVEIVIGSRVYLLGRRIERSAVRHYVGRVFATCASMLLRIPVYDTQCGAKLFRNSTALKLVFGRPFKVNWTFDVEMFARFPIVKNVSPQETSSRWFELPLATWVDVKGSKVKPRDFIKGGFEYCLLFYYLKTPARKLYEKYLFDGVTAE